MPTAVITRPSAEDKLDILTADAQYDLACACGTKDPADHRHRGTNGKWIYPITLPNGGKSVIFKTLLSNACSSDCKYCPLRADRDVRRTTLTPDEIATVFLDYYNRRKVFGLFLSSACIGSADATMARLNTTAKILRKKHNFRGYIHLKVIPGSSSAAIEEAISLSSAVSLNIETPGAGNMQRLSNTKDYLRDIVEPIKLISRLTSRGSRYARVKQSTQFIVGAAGESDRQIVSYAGRLYAGLNMSRIYFSAYQTGLGAADLPGEINPPESSPDVFKREHRLYQVDFLMRKYGFEASEIAFGPDGKLSLTDDPKETWAKSHPENFPLNPNYAAKNQLLRIPGLGPITVSRILKRRKQAKLQKIEDLGKFNARLQKAQKYLTF